MMVMTATMVMTMMVMTIKINFYNIDKKLFGNFNPI
jgi:hypothetical protein